MFLILLNFRRLSKLFALAAILVGDLAAADVFKLENHSYPVGQKTLTGLESGTINQGLMVKVLKNGQPAANELVRFHLSNAAGKNAEVSPLEGRTDKDGIIKATLRIGDAPGEYLVEAFHNGKLETPPIQIRTKALRGGWIFFLVLGLFGGMAIFLFGMDVSSEGLQKAAGDKMRVILGKLTNTPVMGVLVGTVTTAAIQSSTATTVMVIGFVSSTLMTLKQAIGVIFGCNIGTTVTVQLIAFNINEYAPLLIALGFFVSVIFGAKSQALKFGGEIIFGFGLIFFGMGLMSEAMSPMRSVPAFTNLLASFGENPFLGLLVATVFTGLIHSSGAAIGISIALATQGILTLKAAIVIAFGANIGTTVTAMIGSMKANRDGKRVALIHFIFNTVGVLVFMPFIGQFTELMKYLSDKMEPGNISRAIANSHMFFNGINTIIFLPFVGLLEKAVRAIIKDTGPAPTVFKPQFIQPSDIKSSSLSLEQTRRELMRAGQIVFDTVKDLGNLFNPQAAVVAESHIETTNRQVAILSDAIKLYLRDLTKLTLTNNESREATYYLHLAEDMRQLANSLQMEVLPVMKGATDKYSTFNENQKKDLEFLLSKIAELLEKNLQAFETKNIPLAEESGLLYKKLKFMSKKVQSQNLESLLSATDQDSAAMNTFVDVLDGLRIAATDVHQISKTILENQD
ncbi:Na/Pi symporter [Turneriella parva]|uniref:Na/Pi-cotransporter II-related protein n=1 Tax=Turneriella parva (strain ATCC BAA-1111 / DSM 21527 / NCTC 11395 / H) TaxID=869212 RepID=I4B1Z1_TURPD|nr:Na/Pi symporter [Turneriella parva]AFM11298.1 Na/Pi-cotransporter II-related protein [Turneriella parva DSM 21527]